MLTIEHACFYTVLSISLIHCNPILVRWLRRCSSSYIPFWIFVLNPSTPDKLNLAFRWLRNVKKLQCSINKNRLSTENQIHPDRLFIPSRPPGRWLSKLSDNTARWKKNLISFAKRSTFIWLFLFCLFISLSGISIFYLSTRTYLHNYAHIYRVWCRRDGVWERERQRKKTNQNIENHFIELWTLFLLIFSCFSAWMRSLLSPLAYLLLCRERTSVASHKICIENKNWNRRNL